MKYNKLVRDKIPEIIKNKGGKAIIHIADNEEYWSKLKEKLGEEIKEFEQNENIEEIADVLEIVEAIIEFKKFNRQEIKVVQDKKARERGKFFKRIILEES